MKFPLSRLFSSYNEVECQEDRMEKIVHREEKNTMVVHPRRRLERSGIYQ